MDSYKVAGAIGHMRTAAFHAQNQIAQLFPPFLTKTISKISESTACKLNA